MLPFEPVVLDVGGVCVCYVSESVCSYKWCVCVCVYTQMISTLASFPGPSPSLWNVNIKVVQVRRAWYFFSCVWAHRKAHNRKKSKGSM